MKNAATSASTEGRVEPEVEDLQLVPSRVSRTECSERASFVVDGVTDVFIALWTGCFPLLFVDVSSQGGPNHHGGRRSSGREDHAQAP